MTIQKIESQSHEAQSADIKAENITRLKSLFPELLTEGASGMEVNVDVLSQLVGKVATDADEKYGLNWHGKRRARQLALTPSTGTLRPCPEDSVDWDTTQNLMIEGDNLEVLKLLQKSYAGKVKLIYIDPPYNTGKDFVYPDNFQDNIKNYLELTGQVEGGVKISSNTEASGRFHTDWLNMMYPRLKLARNLLQEDGVIFISIDENEIANLRLLASEVFGPENFEATVVPIANPGGRDYKEIAVSHEYLVIFSKSDSYQLNELEKTVSFSLHDDRGGYELRELRNRNPRFTSANRPNLFYPFYVNPDISEGGCCAVSTDKTAQYFIEVRPYNSQGAESVWRWGRPKATAAIVSGNLQTSDVVARKKSDGNWNIYEKCRRSTTKAKSVWSETSMRTEDGTRAARELMGVTVFSHPKSVDLIAKCVLLATNDIGDLILDFFAGSGTTGQAVMAKNAADGGDRRYILVQLPEPLALDNKDQEAGASFCDQLGKPRTIAELTKERLRRAGAKVKADNPMLAGDTGFRVFKLDTSNIRAWNPDRDNLEKTLLDHEEHILPGRTEADIVYELLLKLGLDLCVPIESRTIAGKTVGSIGGGVLMTCLAERITAVEVEALAQGIVAWRKELAPAGDTTCVFRDSAFENDIAKSNLAAILEQYGIANVRSL
jgi:adenine-specific DNA-methyltransferase